MVIHATVKVMGLGNSLAKNSLEVIKKYDLATREHINTRVIELFGEQEAIAFANLEV